MAALYDPSSPTGGILELMLATTESPSDGCNVTSFGDLLVPHCAWFRFIINTVVIGLLAIFGTMGNTISILVLNRDRMNPIVICLLQSLAIADNSLLLVSMVTMSIFFGLVSFVDSSHDDVIRAYIQTMAEPAAYMTHTACVWMNVLIAVNRYIAVCKPFYFRFCTLNKMRAQIGAVFAFAFFLNLPRYFLYVRFHCDNGSVTLHKTDLGNSEDFRWYYINVAYNVLAIALPLALLISLSLLTCLQMRRSARDMENSAVSGNRNTGKEENMIMIIIIVSFILCHGPEAVIKFAGTYFRETNCNHPMYYIRQIGNLLIVFNSSVNFLVYYGCKNSFRKVLKQRSSLFTSGRSFIGVNGATQSKETSKIYMPTASGSSV